MKINEELAVVVLAAGKGTRMQSDLPKVMHLLACKPMIGHVLESVAPLNAARTVVVVGPDMSELELLVSPHETAVQAERLGTAHAVAAGRSSLSDFPGDILIAYGDTPLICTGSYQNMLAKLDRDQQAVVVLGFHMEADNQYGRLLVDENNHLQAIVEFNDCDADQRELSLCNSGVIAVAGGHLFSLLSEIKNDNNKGEFYLTDIVAIARSRGLDCGYIEASEEEVLGVNSIKELQQAETIFNRRIRLAPVV